MSQRNGRCATPPTGPAVTRSAGERSGCGKGLDTRGDARTARDIGGALRETREPNALERAAPGCGCAAAPSSCSCAGASAPRGSVVPLFTKRTFDFANLATTNSLDLVILRAFPVVDAGDAVMRIRVHSMTIPSDASIEVAAYPVAPSCDEPQTDFLGPLLGSVRLTSATSPPALAAVALSPDFGSHLQVVLTANRGSTGGTFTAALSGDIVLKPRTGDSAFERLQTQHAYTPGDNALWYIPFIGTTPVGTLSGSTKEARMTAIHDGWLQRVIVFTTAAAGDTVVGLHINGNASALVTAQEDIPNQIATVFEFGQEARFDRGDRVSVSIDPNSIPNSVNVQAEWSFRSST